MKNGELYEVLSGLNMLADVGLPTKISFAVTKNIIDLESIAKPYMQERNKLLDKYCLRDADGKPAVMGEDGNLVEPESQNARQIDPEKATQYLSELAELDNIECDFNIQKIAQEDIEAISTDLTPRQMAALFKILKEE